MVLQGGPCGRVGRRRTIFTRKPPHFGAGAFLRFGSLRVFDMRYDLVIFDNDGVLVDSESISNTLLAAYLTELGHPTSYEDSVRDYMGAAMHRVHDLVEERSGRRLPDDFDDVFHARVFAAFERDLEPVAGVVDVLEKLAADGVPYCVASSGSHERIRVGHRTTGLARWFDGGRVFSAQDVGRG